MRENLALVAGHDGLEHVVPAVSAVHVAGTQSTAFEVAKLVEHEQRVIAGAGVMAVPDAHLLLAVGGLTLESMSSTMPRGGLRPCTRSIQWPDRSARAAKFLGAASHCVSKRPIWLGEAALRCAASPPTIQRIAGSWRRRSASFTSSYPARRPNTDCRNNPANACRPFLPVRASARTSLAIAVKPSASSSSR